MVSSVLSMTKRMVNVNIPCYCNPICWVAIRVATRVLLARIQEPPPINQKHLLPRILYFLLVALVYWQLLVSTNLIS